MPRQRKTSAQPMGAELLQATFSVSNTQKTFHTPEVERLTDEAMRLLRAQQGAAGRASLAPGADPRAGSTRPAQQSGNGLDSPGPRR